MLAELNLSEANLSPLTADANALTKKSLISLNIYKPFIHRNNGR